MSPTKTSRPTTLQMYPGNHIPAGVIRYGCKCKTLAVINRSDATWIIKRCGRTLRTTGSRVDLRVSHGELVGEHFNGRTTFPARAIEAILRRLGHGACVARIDSLQVKRTMRIRMEGHQFDLPSGADGKTAICWLGDVAIRGSEEA